jgi:energy-coupling factor transporter ATP-binding protein EcfA2
MIGNIGALLSIVSRLPNATKLYGVVQQAVAGDQEAIAYLKREGLYEALDIIRPGSGRIAESAKEQIISARDNIQRTINGDIVDGQCRLLQPWDDLLSWLKSRKWGTFVILGPKGQGKTTLARRLAEVWHKRTGWPVNVVNLYPEDRDPWSNAVPMQRFTDDVKSIIEMLNKPFGIDDKTGEEWTQDNLEDALERFKRRIIIIDEMSLTVGTSGQDSGRLLVRQYMAAARHLELLIIYIGQLTRMMPLDILNCEAVFVKKPNGDELYTDRQEPLSMNLWETASDAFRYVKNAPGYATDYPDVRAWAYVRSQDIGGGRQYKGMMPFSLPNSESVA